MSSGTYTKMEHRRDGTRRKCKECGLWKEQTEFYSHAGYQCKPCRNTQIKENRKAKGSNYVEEEKARHRLRRYGLTNEQYHAMFAEQGGVCGLCDSNLIQVVDHDHSTGKVRALLCHSCNSALGKFKDDPELLRKAARYVESHRLSTPKGR